MLDIDESKNLVTLLLATLIIGGILVAGTAIGAVGTIATAEYLGCQDLQSATEEFNFQWTFWTGCRVQLENGFWISVSDYKYIYGDINLLEVR